MKSENQKTILLVENEVIIAMAEKTTLEKFGYAVIIAITGEEAIEIVEKSPAIDLILMDIDLGSGMDGTEAAAIILQKRDLPVVFLSGHTEPEIIARTEKITAYGFLVKNSSETVLQALIKIVFKLFESTSKEKRRISQGDDALEALHKSEEQYRSIINTFPDGISITDMNGRIIMVSPSLLAMFGCERNEEMLGRSFTDFVFPEDLNRASSNVSRMTQNTKMGLSEYHGLRADGRTVDLEVNGDFVRDADGRPTQMIFIIRDISKRKRAESQRETALQELQEAKALTDAIVENVPLMIFLKEAADLRFVIFNRAGEELLGYDRKALLGKNDLDFFPPEQAAHFMAKDREVLDGEAGMLDIPEEPILTARQGTRLLHTRKVSIRGADEKTKYLMGISEDITERKRTEEALQKNISRLELAMQAADMAWWEMDLPSGHVSFDKRKVEMLGYPEEKFKHYQDFMALVHPDDREKAMNAMRGHLDGSLPRYEVEYRIAASSGEYIWFHDIGSIGDRDAQGKPLNMTGLAINIGGRKKTEAEIQLQLEEKEILLKEVHHRIKNNIASIGGLLSLHMQTSTSPEAAAALQDAIGRIDSMRLLYEKLLLGGDFRDASAKNYIESLARSVVSLFPGLARVKLNLDVDDFRLDPKRLFPLGIIINELLTNIMKHAFAGKKSSTIKLSLIKEGARVTLTLQDNGVGLPSGFDMDASGGFGLMLVKMLSQQLRGSFSIEKHKGTRCTVIFDV